MLRKIFAHWFFLALACALAVSLRAQTTWTAVPSGTTQNLWGVTYGGGQFVAVGEGGTILTSPDGAIWTRRASGTTAWLTSVAHGFGHYLAVGDGGTMLLSSDGATWAEAPNRTVNPRPTDRLNVVGFADDAFMIYGEDSRAVEFRWPAWCNTAGPGADVPRAWWRGFAVGLDHYVVGGEAGLFVFDSGRRFLFEPRPTSLPPGLRNVSGIVFDGGTFHAVGAAGSIVASNDALTWTVEPSPATENLQAITAFNNTLIAVGERGTILSRNAQERWVRRNSPTGELLLDAAASDRVAVIVGGSGTILRATPDLTPPAVVAQPAGVTESLGGAASFVVRATGSAPLSFQWFLDGAPLPGETRAEFVLSKLTAASAGHYTVVVSNATGSATSVPARLNLLPAPTPVVDATFRADASLDGTPTTILPLADGTLLVANGKPRQIVKLRADGSLDPRWATNVFADDRVASFNVLVPQPDGRILVGGSFSTRNGEPKSNLVRLNPDGTVDASFTPASDAASRTISSLALQLDGRILVANGGETPLRLLPNGALDETFRPEPMPPGIIPQFGTPRARAIHFVAATANDKIYALGIANLQFTLIQWRMPHSRLARLNADGSPDPAFAPVEWPGGVFRARVLDDASVVIVQEISAHASGTFFLSQGRVVRIAVDGTPFPGHLTPIIPFPEASEIHPDGRVLYYGREQSGPVRLTALGAVDPTFTGGVGTPTAIATTTGERVVVAGSFDLFDAVPARRVARLNSVPNKTPNAPRILRLVADKSTVDYAEPITVRAAVTGSGPLTYDWKGAPAGPQSDRVLRTASPELAFEFDSRGQPRTLQLVVRNARGDATSATLAFTVRPAPPVVLSQPTRVDTQTGRDVFLRVTRKDEAGMVDVEWRRNGQLVAGAVPFSAEQFQLPSIADDDAGTYTATIRNALGETTTTTPIVVTVDRTSRFTNLSTRVFIGGSESLAIAGFTVTGQRARTVMVRGIGPGLARFGVTAPLADPLIALFDSAGQPRLGSSNDDWHESQREAFAKLGAFSLEAGSKDAAFPSILDPGSYTVHLSGKPGQAGAALIEIYEFDNDAAPMINLSTRAHVRSDAPAIAGFAIAGPVAKRVLLRAVGPGLRAFGVSGVLANPRLTLRDAAGAVVATNDNWGTDANESDLRAAMSASGAFPLGTGSLDAAILTTLAPGNYTMTVEGAANESGVALLEVYAVE